MKKLFSIIVCLVIFGVINGQNYDLKLMQFDHLGSIVVPKDIQGQGMKGTGINNAIEFNDWQPLIPILAPEEVPVGRIMQTGNSDAQKSTDKYIGDFAMHVETGYIPIDQEGTTELMGGVGMTGAIEVDYINMALDIIYGEPYTERPSSMTFYVKGELLSNDTALILFQSSLNSELVGLGGVFLGAEDVPDTDYISYTVPIEYENDFVPDSAQIIVVSAVSGMLEDPDTGNPMEMGTITEGSYIIVDHITMNFLNKIEFIIEDQEGQEISEAHIKILEEGTTDILTETISDENGFAEFNLVDGTFGYLVTKEGYIDATNSFNAEIQEDTIVVVLELHDGPQILERTPEIDETMVALNSEVSITFIENIEEVNFNDITILNAEEIDLENLIISIDGAKLNIEHEGFDYNTTYTVVIPAGTIKDANTEAELAFNISWSFTTINPIADIYGVSNIEVYFNTSEEDAISELASVTIIKDTTGQEHTVDLTWGILDYEGITPGDYDATGTFELPEGVHQSDPETILEVTAIVTVLEPPVIVDIDIYEVVQDISVPYETLEADAIAALETDIKISDSDGGEHAVVLTWTIEGYNGEVPGDYNATGTFNLPFGVDQTDPETVLEVSAIVTVLDSAVIVGIDIYEVVQDITVPYETLEADAIAALETDIKISDSYDEEHEVVLIWTIEDYNGEVPGNYNATGTFELPEGVYQSDPETVLEVSAIVTVDEPSHVEGFETKTISVYPNPASNVLTVANAENSDITILNILGKVVFKTNNSSANQIIDISYLPEGTYFIRVDSKVFKINVVK